VYLNWCSSTHNNEVNVKSQRRSVDLYSSSPVNPLMRSVLYRVNKNVFSRHLKAASVEFGLRTGSGRLFHAYTDQQWQKSGGRTCWVGDVVRAVDYARRNGDVSGWTVGHGERRYTEVADHSDIGASWPPAWTLLDLGHQANASRGAVDWAHGQSSWHTMLHCCNTVPCKMATSTMPTIE